MSRDCLQIRNFYLTLKINELIPKKANVVESYVLLGVARETENLYIITSVVNRFTNQIDSIDVLYSTNIKKESAVSKTRASGITLQSLTDSKISISDLLNIVKDKTPEVLSEDVLNHYGLQRGDSEIERGLIYSAKQTDPIQAHYAEVMRENRNLKTLYPHLMICSTALQEATFILMAGIFITLRADFSETHRVNMKKSN